MAIIPVIVKLVSDSLSYIGLTLISLNVHAPTDGKSDDAKDKLL